jgi:hypothetical protein
MPATDNFANNFVGNTSPATIAEAVTPSDSADLTNVSRALWIGGAGNISVIMANGSTVLFSGIAAGTMLPLRVSRVRSTSTTATLIVAIS